MTSTVTVTAHCAANKQVKVEIKGDQGLIETIFLQDGESAERYVYDDREISVIEEITKPAEG